MTVQWAMFCTLFAVNIQFTVNVYFLITGSSSGALFRHVRALFDDDELPSFHRPLYRREARRCSVQSLSAQP